MLLLLLLRLGMVQVTLKVVALAMTMIVGLAMSLATFITYGKQAVKALADVSGPLACTRTAEFVGASARCDALGVRHEPCYQLFVSHDVDGSGGSARRESLLHPYLADYNASAECAVKECSGPSSAIGVATTVSGETAVVNDNLSTTSILQFARHFQLLSNVSDPFECFIDASVPGHAFVKLEKDNVRDRRYYSRIEAIAILSPPAAILLTVLVALVVCCFRGTLTASPVVREHVNSSYIKIGDKYYMQVSADASPSGTMT